MDLFRQVLGGGEGGEDGDGMEEEALLAYEADSSSSQTSSGDEAEERVDDGSGRHFDVSLPARHLVRYQSYSCE